MDTTDTQAAAPARPRRVEPPTCPECGRPLGMASCGPRHEAALSAFLMTWRPRVRDIVDRGLVEAGMRA